jgi:tRNA(Ile2) C34 agmatinyltransferase TiaS
MNEHDAVAAGEQCPDCGSTDTESNGSTEYRCVECDHRWGTDCNERYGY